MNTEKQLQLVNRKQADLLKEAGFNWEVDRCFQKELQKDEVMYHYCTEDCNAYDKFISAPTVALALKWFRDLKNRFAVINQYDNTKKWYHSYDFSRVYDTFEASESALLDELLIIIEKEKL